MMGVTDVNKLSYGAILATNAERDAAIPLRKLKIARTTVLPKKFQHPETLYYYQNGYGMCVSGALGLWETHAYLKETGKLQKFSMAFIYGNRVKNTWRQEGMPVSAALDDFIDNGTCFWEDFPVIGTYPMCAAGITDVMREKAKPQHALSKCCLFPELDNTKGKILSDVQIAAIKEMLLISPLLYTINVYNLSFSQNPVLANISDNDYFIASHEMLCIGWDDSIECWIMQNSQSTTTTKRLVPYKYAGGQDWWNLVDYVPVVVPPVDPPIPDEPDPPPKPPEPVPFTGFEWKYDAKKKKLTIKITDKKNYDYTIKPNSTKTKSKGFVLSKVNSPFIATIVAKDGRKGIIKG